MVSFKACRFNFNFFKKVSRIPCTLSVNQNNIFQIEYKNIEIKKIKNKGKITLLIIFFKTI